ncbi:MAG: hypothetical protein ABL884_06980 [Methyloglobulus sp.]
MLHLTHRDVGNAANRMERLQPHHPWWSLIKPSKWSDAGFTNPASGN